MENSYTNYTSRAQRVLSLAIKEAERLRHNFIGTEHLLLGMILLGEGTAYNVFIQKMGPGFRDRLQPEVEKRFCKGNSDFHFLRPNTPRTRKVLCLAEKEAKKLGHIYVGTEHILLGLIREEEGIAAQVLLRHGFNMEETRQMVLETLDPSLKTTTTTKRENTMSTDEQSTPRTESGNMETNTLAVEAMLKILYEDYSNLPPGIQKLANELKYFCITELHGSNWFGHNLNHTTLLNQLETPGSNWFAWADADPRKMQIIADIFNDIGGNSGNGLRLYFDNTDHGSVSERRIGIVLQLMEGKPIKRQVEMDFLKM